MAEVVSLSRARKARDQDRKRKQAGANAVKFGRTPAERHRDDAAADKARRDLDAHRRDPDSPLE